MKNLFIKKNLLSLIAIFLLLFLVIGCGSSDSGGSGGSSDDPTTTDSGGGGGGGDDGGSGGGGGDDGGSSGSSTGLYVTMVNQLENDLTKAGYSSTQVSTISSGATQSVSQAGLTSSNDANLVAPVVLKGAELAVAEPNAGLTKSSEKLAAIDVITTSITLSLKDSVSSSSSSLVLSSLNSKFYVQTQFVSPMASQTSINYSVLLNSLATIAVQYLDDAGIDTADLGTAVQTVVECINSQLKKVGISESDIADISKSVSKGAVGALDEAGVSSQQMEATIQKVITGSVKGLKNAGLNADTVKAAADEIASGATSGLESAGVEGNDLDTMIASIKTKIKNDLKEQFELTDDDVNTIDDDLNNSTDTAKGQIPGFVIRLDPNNAKTTEGGAVATFTVCLYSRPRSEVKIPLQSSNELEGKIQSNSSLIPTLIFTPDDWNAPKTVNIKGQDDDYFDENQNYMVMLHPAISEDMKYRGLNPADVSLTNIDDETAGFILSGTELTVSESGGTATFTLKLKSKPYNTVIVPVSSNKTDEGTVDKEFLTFTPENWESEDHKITITGVDDKIDDDDQTFLILLGTPTIGDDDYTQINPDNVTVINVDDDTAGYTFSEISGHTTEDGGEATFTVKLNSQPNGVVEIDLETSDDTEGTVSPISLTFSDENYNSEKTVTIKGVDDEMADGGQPYEVRINVNESTSDDTGYKSINPTDMDVINDDNDSPGLTVSTISGNTTENEDSATFTIRLNSQPDDTVNIDLKTSDNTEGTVSPIRLTFDGGNYNADQTVTVKGVNDNLADGSQPYQVRIEISASSQDTTGYEDLNPMEVAVINIDDETAGVNINRTSGVTTEDEVEFTFLVSLGKQPDDEVVLDFNSNDSSEGSVTPTSLLFTVDNYDQPQRITVTGVNDFLIDGIQSYVIQINVNQTSTYDDTGYKDLTISPISMKNLDNDAAGLKLAVTSVQTNENGSSSNITLSLNAEPTDEVIVSFASSDESEAIVTNGSLHFFPSNWNEAQIINIAGVDDDELDGSQNLNIILSVSSQDSNYQVLGDTQISVTNEDNEPAIPYTLSYTFNEGYGVTDSNTFLMWQRDGAAYGIDNYKWYSANAYCLNATIGGYTDWRLPRVKELTSIVDYTKYNPAVKGLTFINTRFRANEALGDTPYWTSMAKVGYESTPPRRWAVGFSIGDVSYEDANKDIMEVRCVRGGTETDLWPVGDNDFIDNDDGTIYHKKTGLTWEKNTTAEPGRYSHAESYCNNLDIGNHDDWRLPEIKELQSIVDYDTFDPAINSNIFPSTASSDYWSSTVYIIDTKVWRINFEDGTFQPRTKSTTHARTRCVRR